MKKIVAVFADYQNALKASNELVSMNISDYSLAKLSEDYEQQIRQEVFLRSKEAASIMLGGLVGALLMGLLFYWMTQNNDLGILYGRFLAGGLPSTLFAGTGIGLALGSLLTGIYSIPSPFHFLQTQQDIGCLYYTVRDQLNSKKLYRLLKIIQVFSLKILVILYNYCLIAFRERFIFPQNR